MARRKVVVMVCDMCDRTGQQVPVETHTVAVDGHGVEAEVCDECWANNVLSCIAVLSAVGRPARRKRVKQPEVVQFPGVAWQFTAHALQRIGERHLDPMEVVEAADNPRQTWPGRLPESVVHERDGIKAVVVPDRYVIITAAGRGDDVEEERMG